MNSGELEDGSPVRVIYNLCGHSIGNYKIHDGLAIPLVDNGDQVSDRRLDVSWSGSSS